MMEMLVVLGIVALVAAMTIPMLVPLLRTRTLDAALDTVKSACTLARSTAIEQRKMINLTLLQQTDATHGPGVVLTAYDFAGAVTGVASNTIQDANQNWVANAFQYDQVLLFRPGVTPYPQVRKIQSNTSNTITIYKPPYNPTDPNDPNEQDWNPVLAPADVGDIYVVMSSGSLAQPYCIHNLNNFFSGKTPPDAAPDVRFNVLKTFSQYMGQTVQYLPTGCQFTFSPAWSAGASYTAGSLVSDKGADYVCAVSGPISGSGTEPPNANWQPLIAGAWTYVFLPDGEVWTLTSQAQNVRDANWFLTTYMSNGAVSGPKIWGPQNLTSATVIVYATTGQAVSQ